MRYELSIDASYLDDDRWNTAAGIREFLQNARDAEIEQNAPLSVRHNADSEKLIIENEGATLTRDVLLLGRSTKRDRPDLAGQWGEGLKLGALALLRAGHKVVIRNGSELWLPSIEKSERFAGRDVLVFTVTSGRAERARVRVEVSGVSAEDWAVLQDHFLFLQRQRTDLVSTPNGALLLGAKQKGCIYVKGILVQRHHTVYGYDLHDAQLDRDRRMVDRWDLDCRLRDIWYAAVHTRPDLIAEFHSLLDAGAPDVDGVAHWNVQLLPEVARRQIVDVFKQRHGADAVPVATLADSADVAHLGRTGIIVKKQLQAVLEASLGPLDDVKKSLANEAVRSYARHELTSIEWANLERAIELVHDVVPDFTLADVDVCDFRDPNLLGQYVHATGRIRIARSVLADRAQTLRVCVHEVAHKHGGDGDKAHVNQLEVIWSTIVEKLAT